MVGAVLWPLIRLAIFTAIVRGFFLWLSESHDVHVDREVAVMIGVAESAAAQVPEWLLWIIAGGCGFLLMIIWEIVRHKKWLPWQKGEQSQGSGENIATSKANLEEWMDVDPLELWRAGCLWKGTAPHYPISFHGDPAYPAFIRLVNAAKAGRLTVTQNGEIDAHSLVSRKELHRFAHEIGDIPEFLSPREPIIVVELVTDIAKIGDFIPSLGLRITNTGQTLDSKCLVQIENHEMKAQMPEPFILRSEGQIRGKRIGPFTLRKGQPKLIPIILRRPGRINEFLFIGEDGQHYGFMGGETEFDIGIYGADESTRVHVRVDIGENWKVRAQLEYL